MKNIALQVLNSNRWLAIGLTVLCTVMFSGCKDKEPQTLIGTVENPSWTATSDYDMTASMTAIVKVDLSLSFPKQIKDAERAVSEEDVLAAFVGETCVGQTSPVGGLFYLYIAGPLSAGENTVVTLRYYSSVLKNTFVATETIPFRNDERLGTVSQPYIPEWLLAK